MRIALAGTGRIGSAHARTLAAHPKVSSLVVADADPERAAALAARTGAETAADVDALFAAGPEALVVTAATAAHAPLIARA
ncbi:dehydrogenase, partial [Streptomyces sp. NRRL F-6602]